MVFKMTARITQTQTTKTEIVKISWKKCQHLIIWGYFGHNFSNFMAPCTFSTKVNSSNHNSHKFIYPKQKFLNFICLRQQFETNNVHCNYITFKRIFYIFFINSIFPVVLGGLHFLSGIYKFLKNVKWYFTKNTELCKLKKSAYLEMWKKYRVQIT